MKYQAMPGYVSRVIAGEMLLIPVGSTTQDFNGMIHLNETGMFIWEHLKEAKSLDDLMKAFKAEYDGPEDVMKADIGEFLTIAIKQNLVKEV